MNQQQGLRETSANFIPSSAVQRNPGHQALSPAELWQQEQRKAEAAGSDDSPLCPRSRMGCARGHDGKVLVEKRLCTSATYAENLSSWRSLKYSGTCTPHLRPRRLRHDQSKTFQDF